MIAEAIIAAITILGCYAMHLYAAREEGRAVKVALKAASDAEDTIKSLVAVAGAHEKLTKEVLLEHNERIKHIEFWKAKQGVR